MQSSVSDRAFTRNFFSVPPRLSRATANNCCKMRHPWSPLYRHWLASSISLHSGFLWMLLLLYMTLACLGEPMKIRPKMCTNALGEEGTCMFVWECIKTEGKHLGTCVDGFLFGSCCGHNEAVNSIGNGNEHWTQTSVPTTKPPSSSTDSVQPSSVKWQPKPSLGHTTMTVSPSTPSSSTVTRVTSTTTSTTPQPITNFVTISAAFDSYLPPNHSPLKPYPNRPWFIIQSNKPSFISTVRPINRPSIPFPVKSTTHRPAVISMTQLSSTNSGSKWNTSAFFTTPEWSSKVPSSTVTTTPSSTTELSHPNHTLPNASPDKVESVLVENSVGESLKHKSQCGITQVKPKKKVVGGKNSAFGAWPWQVSVRRTSFFGFTSTHRCGGAILSNEWIATAGHCVDDLLLTQIRIRVGEFDFSTTKEPLPYIERGARKKVVHPKYNFFTYENDLALIQLDEPIEFQPHVSSICLPPDNIDLLGKNATVTGWGRLSEGGVLPTVLQEVRVPIVSNDKCKNMFLSAGRHEYIPDIFMCAGYDEGGRDSCQGDSGGPLQVQGDDGRWFLAGIISWGIGCGEPSLPGVCTRITKFKQWILSYIAV